MVGEVYIRLDEADIKEILAQYYERKGFDVKDMKSDKINIELELEVLDD